MCIFLFSNVLPVTEHGYGPAMAGNVIRVLSWLLLIMKHRQVTCYIELCIGRPIIMHVINIYLYESQPDYIDLVIILKCTASRPGYIT